MTQHSALAAGRVAVITGGASGIGLAVAQRCAELGMHLALVDRDSDALAEAASSLDTLGAGEVRPHEADVRDPEALEAVRDAVLAEFDDVALLMNNAGVGGGGGPWERPEAWQRVVGVNFWGVVNGMQTFVPAMLARGRSGAIVNTGSKQGITNPPGDAAYNASKAAVKSATESLAHALRQVENCALTAHLLVPGFTWTGMIRARIDDKPAAAWWPEQVADLLLERMGRGDFYVICPDNDVSFETDVRRMRWNLGDLIENRPALSRWDPRYAEAFAAFMAADDA
ncbi:MAG TPA: SDR family NAD(P)-dependent oxidoreductase [Pseudomonadales bacterium]|nr:SDR family NAD(P)-dependent oxidoreductase [Pseudomonadales bacterium]